MQTASPRTPSSPIVGRACAVLQETVLLAAMMTLASACSDSTVPELRSGFATAEVCPDRGSEGYYLAPDRLAYDRQNDQRVVSELSHLISTAGLGPLWCGGEPEEAYRAIWRPSYRPAFIASLESLDHEWRTTWVVFGDPRDSVRAGTLMPNVEVRTSAVISPAVAATLVEQVRVAGLWAAPSLRLSDGDGSDGGNVIFEARRGSTYQIVNYWQPNDEPLGDVVRALVRTAGGTVPPGLMPRR
jgi:hypothetical protein